jgi:hypothetical protein
MEQTLSVPDGIVRDVNRFAATHDIPDDRAYELLLAVGIDVLDDVELNVSLDEDRLVLECPQCTGLFESPPAAVDHECGE